MHARLAAHRVVGRVLLGHPERDLAVVPAIGTDGHRIFTTVWPVDYAQLLPRVGMKGIADPDRRNTGIVPGYGSISLPGGCTSRLAGFTSV